MCEQSRILLILDVDETLIFGSETPLAWQPNCQVGPYFVYRRPHLAEFLLACQQHFDLAVWSSSSADYLDAVISALFPQKIELRFVWSRGRCVQRFDPEWHTYYFVKDLKKVKRKGYDLDRVLIVDDTPQKIERNFGNAIYVKPYFGESDDRELLRLQPFLESLRLVPNVRQIEKRDWRFRTDIARTD